MRKTKGGSYVLEELDGTQWKQGVAAFRLLPYVSREDSRLQELADMEDLEEDTESDSDTESADTHVDQDSESEESSSSSSEDSFSEDSSESDV